MTSDEQEAFRSELNSAVVSGDLRRLKAVLSSPACGTYVRETGGRLSDHTWRNAASSLDLLELLWESGLRFEPEKDFPLLISLIGWRERAEALPWFVNHGYPIDLRNRHGATALEVAYELARDDAVDLLQSRGAAPRISSTNELIRALKRNDFDLILDLRGRGASPWEGGAHGISAYQIASDRVARWGRQENDGPWRIRSPR
jgi:hypothetical protein